MTAKKPTAKMGRPTKRTPANREQILRNIRAGLLPDIAAETCGLARQTFREWRLEDLEFAGEVEQARAMAIARKVGYIEQESAHSWKAAAWLLERADPSSFGKRLNLAGADGGDLTVRVVRDDTATPPEHTDD